MENARVKIVAFLGLVLACLFVLGTCFMLLGGLR